ncbi:hypothetical protein D1872_293320 [compost metagenome]
MDNDDPQILALLDIFELACFALKQNIPFVRSVWIYTAKHFHQRGFSCTVLTAQRMNFAFPDLEIDVLQCFDPRKGFGNALHFQYDSGHGICSFPLLFQSNFFFGVISGAYNVLLHVCAIH